MSGTGIRTLVLITLAVVVGGGILFALVRFGPSTPTERADLGPAGAVENLPAPRQDLQPEPAVIDEEALETGTQRPRNPGTSQRFEYESTDESGRVTMRIQGGTTEPLPNGRLQVPDPIAFIYVSDSQLVRVSADLVEIVGTELDPESGTLAGNVWLRLYEIEPTSADDIYRVDLDTIEPSAELSTDSVRFDREINEFSTDDRFVMRSRRFVVAGRGFRAIYNEIGDRIEHFDMTEREFILIREAPDDVRQANREATPRQAAKDDAARGGDAEEQDGEIPAETPRLRAEEEDRETPLFYRVSLTNEVYLQSGLGEEASSAHGDQLTIDLAVAGADSQWDSFMSEVNPARQASLVLPVASNGTLLRAAFPPSVVDAARASSENALEYLLTVSLFTSTNGSSRVDAFSNDPTKLDPATVVTHFPIASPTMLLENDVIVLGKGALLATPLDSRPDSLASDSDVRAVLEGSPVVLRSPDLEARCRRLEHHSEAERTRLFAGPTRPIDIDLRDGSRATTQYPLEIDRGQNRITFTGSGEFESDSGLRADETESEPREENGFSAKWTESLTIQFDDEDPASAMKRVRRAELRGNVRLADRDGYTLESDRVIAEFNPLRQQPDQNPRLERVRAFGRVHLQAEDGEIEADELDVSILDRGVGQPVPRVAEFSGHVQASNGREALRCGYLRAEFTAPDSREPQTGSGFEQIESILATESVHIMTEDGGEATGDRLEASPAEGTARLIGDRIRVIQDQVVLLTTLIELDRAAGRVEIPKPGVLYSFEWPDGSENEIRELREHLASEDSPLWLEARDRLSAGDMTADSSGPSEEVGLREETADAWPEFNVMRIAWHGGMSYTESIDQDGDSQGSGEGEFIGSVLATSSASNLEHNSVQAERLWFTVISQPEGSVSPKNGSDATQPDPGRMLAFGDLRMDGDSGRQIELLRAFGADDVPARLQAQRFKDATRRDSESIFYIDGPTIDFFRPGELLTVDGRGSMFLFDAREPAEPSNSTPAAGASSSEPSVGFTGRGRTLFQWTGSLVMDGAKRHMTLTDDVLVRHRPLSEETKKVWTSRGQHHAPDSGALDLWCQSLQAESADPDEVDALDMSGQFAGDLQFLRATGQVYVVTPTHEIITSNLEFNQKTQLAVLEGSASFPVSVTRSDAPSVLQATRLYWDMFADSIHIEKPEAVGIAGAR